MLPLPVLQGALRGLVNRLPTQALLGPLVEEGMHGRSRDGVFPAELMESALPSGSLREFLAGYAAPAPDAARDGKHEIDPR